MIQVETVLVELLVFIVESIEKLVLPAVLPIFLFSTFTNVKIEISFADSSSLTVQT